MIGKEVRPRLASKARLRFDRHAQRHMLLYPDRGMLLNPSAAAIVQLCTGENTLEQIVQQLSAADSGASPAQLEQDVQAFLAQLLERALVRLEP